MAKQADVELRIRSKDLSGKSVSKLTSDLNQLIEAQEQQRRGAAASSSALKQLESDFSNLGGVIRELSSRRALLDKLIGKKEDLAQAKTQVNALRVELAELMTMRTSGNFVGDIEKAITNVRKQLGGADSQFNKLGKVVAGLEDRLKGLGVGTENAESSLRELISVQDEAVVAQARTSVAIRETTAALQQEQAAARQAANAERERQAELAESIRFEQQRAEAARRFRMQEALATLGPALERDEAAERRMLAIRQRADAVEKRLADTRQRLADAAAGLTTQTDRARRSQDAFSDSGRKSLSFLQRQRGQLLSLAAAYFGVFEAINVGRRAIETDVARQGAMIRLQVAAKGDIAEAGREFQFVRDEADRLGQSLTPLANQYSKFKIAAEGAGQSADVTRQVFTNFSEAATVLQLSQENVDGIFRALEQSFSKGIVQAEELRGQLGDRLPGAFTKLASAIGVSNAELNKLLEQGKVSADVLPLLGEFLADEVAGQLPDATRNTRAEIERLKTAYDDFLVTIANSGLSDTIRQLSIDLRAFFASEDGKQFAQDIATAFATVVNAGRTLLGILGGPNGIISLVKVLIAINIARWAGSFVSSIGQGVRSLATMRTAMAATSVSAQSMGRAFALALGPIGVAVTLAAEAMLYFEARSEAAADAAEAQAQKIDELRRAHGDQLDSLVQLNEKELDAERQAYDTAKAKRAEAAARLRAAEAALAEVKAQGQLRIRGNVESYNNPEADRLLATIAKSREELVDLNTQMASFQSKQSRTSTAKARADKEASAANMEAAKRVAALQSELDAKGTAERLKNDKAYYNDFVGRMRDTAKFVSSISNERLDATLEDSFGKLQQQAARVRAEVAGIDFSGLNKDKDSDKAEKARLKAERAAERAEEKRIAIADKAKEALLKMDSDIAEARINNEAATTAEIEANLRLKLEALDADIAKRRSDLEALRREAEKFGTPAAVQDVDSAIGKLDDLRSAQVTSETRESRVKALEAAEQRVNDIVAQRDAQIELINIQREAGLKSEIAAQDQILEQRRLYADSIRQSVNDVLALIAAIAGSDPDLAKKLNLEGVKAQFEGINAEAQDLRSRGELLAQTYREDFAAGSADALATLGAGLADVIKGTGSLSDAFSSAADAFLNFAADFLINIGKMILQQIILNALQNSGSFGGLGGMVAGVMHSGGPVGGSKGMRMNVSPLVFAGAPRYHTGGFPGLASDEVPIIAQKGEEVLAKTDPRNALNGGGLQKAPDLKIINAVDSAQVVTEAMNRREGQQPIVNMIRARAGEIKQILGV